MIVSFDDKSTPISTIPFPAITICSTDKFQKEKVNTDLLLDVLIEMETNKTTYEGLNPEMYESDFYLCYFEQNVSVWHLWF